MPNVTPHGVAHMAILTQYPVLGTHVREHLKPLWGRNAQPLMRSLDWRSSPEAKEVSQSVPGSVKLLAISFCSVEMSNSSLKVAGTLVMNELLMERNRSACFK